MGFNKYNNNELLDGGTYKVEVPFEHMQFERLVDRGTRQNVQVGYMIMKMHIKGEPLLFYSI